MQTLGLAAWLAVVPWTYAFVLADAGALTGSMEFLAAWAAMFSVAIVGALLSGSQVVLPALLSGILAAGIYAAAVAA